ncbi:hypothetical protein ACFLZK_02485 [Patescibacteria group bacterium]
MEQITKREKRQELLKELQDIHKEIGVENFPKRFGISTNEKKFREISFRVKKGVEEQDATADDIIVSKQPVYGMNHSIVAYAITYRIWLPQEGGKFPGTYTIRFDINTGVAGIVRIGKFYIAVEHDYFAIQQKSIGFARMFGVSESDKLDTLANILLAKEFPFLLDNIKSVKTTQLGKSVEIDPSTRNQRMTTLLIDLELDKKVDAKEELATYIDHRNPEMLLHHIFTEQELKEILEDRTKISTSETEITIEDNAFIDNFSLWALAVLFLNKL